MPTGCRRRSRPLWSGATLGWLIHHTRSGSSFPLALGAVVLRHARVQPRLCNGRPSAQDTVFRSRLHFRFYAKKKNKEKQRRITTAKSLQSTTSDEWRDENRVRVTGRGKGEEEGASLNIEQRHIQDRYNREPATRASYRALARSMRVVTANRKKKQKRGEPKRHEPTNTDRRRTEWADERENGEKDTRQDHLYMYTCIYIYRERGARHGVYCTTEAS